MLRFALLQINTSAGAVAGNRSLIQRTVESAANAVARGEELLCIAPELALSGSPLGTLPQLSPFLSFCREQLDGLAADLASGPALLVGCPEDADGNLLSSLFLLSGGTVTRLCSRPLEEALRYGSCRRTTKTPVAPCAFTIGGHTLAAALGRNVSALPSGAEALVIADVEPFEVGLWTDLEVHCGNMAKTHAIPLMRVNAVGGNGGWIFPGGSFTADAHGKILQRATPWQQDIVITSIEDMQKSPLSESLSAPAHDWGDVWNALVLGIRDYVRKSGFERVLLGLSGGMDSSLVAAMAVEALGADKVTGILMPSPWSSQGSLDDSYLLAENLGIATHTVSIAPLMSAFETTLAPLFAGTKPDSTEENLQARIRGCILMAWSNKFRAMLLSTSNKSEAAVGYGTLYGDMAGSLAPIVDVYKTDVYRLAAWFNQSRKRELIPLSVFEKAPSAELRPDQKDQDSLPPYDVLDECLRTLFEGSSLPEFAASPRMDEQTLHRTAELVRRNEFKRHQSTQGLFVSARPLAMTRRPLPSLSVE